MTFDLATAQELLAAQPFSRLVGARITVFEPGRAVLEVDVRDELRQQFGFVHGGVLAYLADNALTFAGGAVLGPAVLTAGVSLDYVRPAPGDAGGIVSAEALVVTSTRRSASCRAELSAGGKIVAVAQGMIRAVELPPG